jgi:diguanylate cyclase (GGDEF)-like protein/PAS domain S-box-containing protein
MTADGRVGVTAGDLVVFDRLSDLIVGTDAAGTVTYTNPKVALALGYQRRELVGRNVIEFLHPDDLAEGAASLEGLIDGDIGVEYTPVIYRIKRSDGSYMPVEFNATPLLTEGVFAGWLLFFGRYPGDQVLDQTVSALLTSGASPVEIIELAPEYGRWRHPRQQYAIAATTGEGERLWTGTPLAVQLGRAHDEDGGTPWARAVALRDRVTARLEDLPASLRTDAVAAGLEACVAVPAPDPLSHATATVVAWSTANGPEPDIHRYVMDQMARVLTLAERWRLNVAKLERAARFDALTGLTNRASFFDYLQSHETLGDETVAMLYVDLDDFKEVNDRFGHGAGDEVLSEVGRRMSQVVRERDLLARLGGDEFAVLCRAVHTLDEATGVADRLLATLAAPLVVDGSTVSIGASIGIAVSSGGPPTVQSLVDRADQAMYLAKANGRNQWRLAAE